MPRTTELVALLRATDREFRRVHRNRGLQKELERFYVDRFFAPEAARILRDAAPLRMLTAKDLEAWLRIDRKTSYYYVVRGLIPHIRIQSNVRFREPEIRRWINQHRRASSALGKTQRRKK